MVEFYLLSKDSPSDMVLLAEDGTPNSETVMESSIEGTRLNMNTQAQPFEQIRQFGNPFYYWYNLLWPMMWQYRLGRSASSGTGAQMNNQQRSATTSQMIDVGSSETDALRDVEVGSTQPNDETQLPMTTDRTSESENITKALSKREQKIVVILKQIRDFVIVFKMALALPNVTPSFIEKRCLDHGAGRLHYVAGML